MLEKSAMKNEIGAAIALQPNCTALLRHLGVEPEEIGATTLLNVRTILLQSLVAIFSAGP